MTNLILASTSVYRKALLERLGLTAACVAPDVDEETWKAKVENPRELAASLAAAKARAVAAHHPGQIVIGGDQVVAIDGQILGKPGSPDRAAEQLARLQGCTHEIITAMTVIGPEGTEYHHMDISRMTMRHLVTERIARYVSFDNPVDCAGSYKLESGGIALFERIETADHTAITGLPLMALTTILESLEVKVPGR
jgi:septum formation protein